jgi:hypothetical protein
MATESRHEPHRLEKGGKAEEAEIQQYHSHTREYTYHRNISANIPRSLECLCAWIHLTALSQFSLELGGLVARGFMPILIDAHIHHTSESSRQMKSLIRVTARFLTEEPDVTLSILKSPVCANDTAPSSPGDYTWNSTPPMGREFTLPDRTSRETYKIEPSTFLNIQITCLETKISMM